MTKIKDIVKKHLPDYRVNDATNRYSYEFNNMIKIVNNIPKLIIYAQRTENNKDFFDYFCKINKTTKPINVIFMYGRMAKSFETYEYISDNEIESMVRLIANDILECNDEGGECVVCSEIKQEVVYCIVCGAKCCEYCIYKMLYTTKEHVKCPVCKSYEMTFDKQH